MTFFFNYFKKKKKKKQKSQPQIKLKEDEVLIKFTCRSIGSERPVIPLMAPYYINNGSCKINQLYQDKKKKQYWNWKIEIINMQKSLKEAKEYIQKIEFLINTHKVFQNATKVQTILEASKFVFNSKETMWFLIKNRKKLKQTLYDTKNAFYSPIKNEEDNEDNNDTDQKLEKTLNI
ncbi:MAG: hypothetical protein PVI75_07485 [Gammaproteobacteria bacterium]|jgi:hypothetical protein